MAIGETAQLAVELNLGGNFAGGMSKAESQLGSFNAAAATTGSKTSVVESAFGRVGSAAASVGGALQHAGSQLKGLVTGPLGMIGLTAGVLSFGGALEQSISKAQDEGQALEKLTLQTGDSAESLSALIAVADRYGISSDRLSTVIGIESKNLETLGKSAKSAAAFQDQFGISVLDSKGKVQDASTFLLNFADYYSKATDRTLASAAAAKVFGRSYVDLLPILALGKQGILDAEAAAQQFGLVLTAQNVADLAKARNATRDWSDALHGLELQIGVNLLPEITDFATDATHFITDHRTDIVAFFKNAASEAEHVAGQVGQVIGALSSAWNGIPPELRDFIIKGVVADRTIKFLFGFDPVAAIGSGISTAVSKAIGGTLGGLFQRGATPVNPQYVAVVNGGAGGLPGTSGGGGIGNLIALGLGIPAIIAEITGGVHSLQQEIDAINQGDSQNAIRAATNLGSPGSLIAAGLGLGNGPAAKNIGTLARGPVSPGFGGIDLDTSLYKTTQAVNGLAATFRDAPWLSKLEASWTKAGQTMHDKIQAAIKGLSGPNAGAAAAFLGGKLGNAGFGAGGYDQALDVLKILKAMDQKDAGVLAAEREISARLPRLKTDKTDLEAALKEANSTDPKNEKLTKLESIMSDLRAHGDRTTQSKVQGVINAVKHQKLSVTVPVRVSLAIAGIGQYDRTVVNHRVSSSVIAQ